MTNQDLPVYGPYETDQAARDDAGPLRHVAGGMTGGQATEARYDWLAAELSKRGVDLGDHDESVLRWFCRWEPETVMVVLGVVSRAYVAGAEQ